MPHVFATWKDICLTSLSNCHISSLWELGAICNLEVMLFVNNSERF